MIKNIARIKGCGIFNDYKRDAELSNFQRYNIIYGWNGSGKSTLAKIFRAMEKQTMPNRLEAAQFEINLNDNQVINNSNLSQFPYKIFVFNQDFVQENINWDETVKSILLISEEKIEERKKLDFLKLEKHETIEKIAKLNEKTRRNLDEQSKFLTDAAKRIKENFRLLDPTDREYTSYNKVKLENYIKKNNTKLRQEGSQLSEIKLKQLTQSVQSDIKAKVELMFQPIDYDKIMGIRQRVLKLLSTDVITKSIERLKDNPDISKWVEDGLEIRIKHKSDTCEFCGSKITEKRLEQLKDHFNDSYKELKQKLNTAKEWLQANFVFSIDLPEKNHLYEEFYEKYVEYSTSLKGIVAEINATIAENWIPAIEMKQQNPFGKIDEIHVIDKSIVNAFNEQLSKLVLVVNDNNEKSVNFDKEVKNAKKKLELHYCCEAVNDFNYFNKISENEQIELNKKRLIQDEKKLAGELLDLEKKLSNEILGATQFNDNLSKFLGHREIALEFDEVHKGYKIIRNSSKQKAFNLSEGEKTAIAFVYFITKLKEHDNSIEDSIIVIDDPVSSLDANHLYHAYSYLKCECESPYQMFILTHNFGFFSLVRDWLLRKNKKNVNTHIYSIEVIPGEIRMAEIRNASAALTNYQSEYHYLFHKLYKYREQSRLNLDEAFLVANLSRKLLEGFLGFKFPKHRNDFGQLFDVAIKDKTKREKLYRLTLSR